MKVFSSKKKELIKKEGTRKFNFLDLPEKEGDISETARFSRG